MPVSSEISISDAYYPNGATFDFSFDFKAASADEVVAVNGDGVLISKALYSVTLDEDEGGTLTFVIAPQAADYPVLYVMSDPALTQPSDFDNAGPSFNPAAITRALDRARTVDLKQQREIDRGLKVRFGEEAPQLPAEADRGSRYPVFSADGKQIFMSHGTGSDPALRADLAEGGGYLVGIEGGATLQDAISIADDTASLLAMVKPLTAGAYVRTADGFVYEVAPAIASDHHLTTSGGVKLYVIPQGPSARQWGVFPNMGVDVWRRVQNALDNMPIVEIEAGVYLSSKGLRQTRDGSVFRGAGRGKTIIRAHSPANNGEADGSDGSEAIVWASAPEGSPIYGLRCEDMTLDCAGLMTGLPVGDVHLKGHHYRRVHNFEVNRVEVIDCGSYAFWANDKTIEAGGTITGCVGVYNDCVAKDAEIFFETTGRCFVTYNRPRAEQTRGSWAWPVYETYHFYGGDGLITVNDGYAKVASSTVIGPLLTQKNVVWNGGYYEQLNPATTVINMSDATGNFDDWAFNDVTMVGAGAVGALSFGGLSGPDNKMTIKGGKFIAKAGIGPEFTAISAGWGSVDISGADCISTTTGAAVPYSLIASGTFKHFRVAGGNQEIYGPASGPSPVNAPSVRSFDGVTFLPASSVTATVRQSKRGSATFANGGGFAQINLPMPLNVVAKANLVVTGGVEASGVTPTGAGEGVSFSWNYPGTNFVNILAPSAAVGRTFNYLVTEYE